MRTLIIISLAVVMLSCSKNPEDYRITSDWVNYSHGQVVEYTDMEGNPVSCEIEFLDDDLMVMRFESLFPLYFDAEGNRVVMSVNKGSNFDLWSESYRGKSGPDPMGILKNYGVYEFCDQGYGNTLETSIANLTTRYNIYLQLDVGVIAIKEKWGSAVLQLCE